MSLFSVSKLVAHGYPSLTGGGIMRSPSLSVVMRAAFALMVMICASTGVLTAGDSTPPTVVLSVPSATLTSSNSITITATYDDDTSVNGITLADSDVTITTLSGAVAMTTGISGSGNATRTITLSGFVGNGTFTLMVNAGTATDGAGNFATASAASATITVDTAAPTITLGAPSPTLVSNASPVTIPVNFADAGSGVTGITLVDANVTVTTASGTATATAAASGSGLAARTITLSNVTGNGALTVSVVSGTATDGAGNVADASGVSAVIVVDNAGPTVSLGAPSATLVKSSDSATIAVNYTDVGSSVAGITLANGNVTVTTLSGTASATAVVSGSGLATRTITLSSFTGNGLLQVTVAASTATDSLGNPATASAASAVITVDNTGPTVTLGTPSATTVKNSDSVTIAATYADAGSSVAGITLVNANVTVTTLSGTAGATAVVSGSGLAARTITLSSFTGNGTLSVTVAANTATDSRGNNATASAASAVITVNNQPNVYLGGGTTTDVTLGAYSAGSPAVVIAPSATIVTSPTGLQIVGFTATLTNRPDGTAEQLNVSATPNVSVAWNNLAGTLTLTGSSATTANYISAIQSLTYLNTNGAPTAGARVIECSITDSVGGISPVAIATIPVDAAVAAIRLTLSGNLSAPDTTLSYSEGAGAVAIAQASLVAIANTAPVWTVNTGVYPYNPPYIAKMLGLSNWDFNFSFGSGSYVDAMTIAVSNPAPTGFGSVDPSATVETISFTPRPGFSPSYSQVGSPPGAYWQYDGQYRDATYSVHGQYFNGGSPFDITKSTPTNTSLWTMSLPTALTSGPVVLSGKQDADQATIPLTVPGATPIPNDDAESIIRSLAYLNTSANPSRYGFQRRVTVTVRRAGVPDSVARVDIAIVPTNHVPVVTGPVNAYSVFENDDLNAHSVALNGLNINDSDGNGFTERLTLSVSNGTLDITTTTGLTVSGDGTATLVLEGALDGSTGALSSALANGNITYTPNLLFTGSDSLSVTLDDLGHASVGFASPLSTSGVFPITVVAVNQPPLIVVPATRTVPEVTDLIITNVGVTDADAGSAEVQATISASQGTIILAGTTGLSVAFTDAEGTGTPATLAALAGPQGTMTFRGSIANINTALNTLIYRANAGFYGDHDTVTVRINDLGNSGARVGVVRPGVTPSTAPGSSAWLDTKTINVVVNYRNQVPQLSPSGSNPLTENRGVTVPVNDVIVLKGGSGIIPTYPLLNQPRNPLFTATTPVNAGTAVLPDSNLVAWDEETKDPRGLTFRISLGVSQGTVLRKRPTDPPTGIRIVAVPVTSEEANSFTQDDLNLGYVSYTHNGALSGDDGFVFTVRDDNPLSCPAAFGSPPATDASQGESAPIVFNIGIDRTLPQVFLSGAAPVFAEPATPGLAVPVLIDSGVQLFNASDTNVPRQFAPAGNSGANITAAITIPSGTRVAVHPAPAIQGGDDLDELGIQESGSVHPGPLDPMTGITQLVYGSSFASGTPIGSFTGGRGGVPLVISLVSPSPLLVSTVEDVIKHLTFSNTSSNPSASPRAVSIQVVNGATSASTTVTKTVTVVPYNQAPVLSSPRRILAVPNVAVPFAITRGAATDQTVVSLDDPDGEVTYAITPAPVKGTVSTTAVPGVFTYTAAVPTASVTGTIADQFTLTVTDNGLVSDGATPVSKSSTPLVIEVVITDVGAVAPIITSNPPFEAAQGSLLSYTPMFGQTYAPGQLSFTLITSGPAMTPALGFSTSDGTITWPAGWALPNGTGLEVGVVYQRLGILVKDLVNETAAYQPLMLRVVQAPSGSN
jgi:Cadherin-like